MSEDSTSPFTENAFLQKMAKSVERIELRLVGDPDLQSTGLVQDVTVLQRQQEETAKILERVVERLDGMDKVIVARDDIVTKSTLKKWVAVACVVMPVLGGAVTWLWNNGFVHITLNSVHHP